MKLPGDLCNNFLLEDKLIIALSLTTVIADNVISETLAWNMWPW